MDNADQSNASDLLMRLLSPAGWVDLRVSELVDGYISLLSHKFDCCDEKGVKLGLTTLRGGARPHWTCPDRVLNFDWSTPLAKLTGASLVEPKIRLEVLRPRITSLGSGGTSGAADRLLIANEACQGPPKNRWAWLGVSNAQDAFRCAFPQKVRDLGASKAWSGSTNLEWMDANVLVVISEDGDRIGFRFSDPNMVASRMVEFAHTAGWILSFSLGVTVTGELTVVDFNEGGQALQAEWFRCREVNGSASPCLPSSWSQWGSASRVVPEQAGPIPPARWVAAIRNTISDRRLAGLMEMLTTAAGAPLGMRGALAALTLEGLAQFLGHKPPPLVVGPEWDECRGALEAVVVESKFDDDVKRQIKARVRNLSRPSNDASLLAPFNKLQIRLTDGEREALKDRNKYLHGRWDADADEWRPAYVDESLLLTAVNKLMLHAMGLGGVVMINHGERAKDIDPAPQDLFVDHYCIS